MPSKTLKQLRLDARRIAGTTADADAVPDDAVNTYINEAWHELYDLIIDADDARIFAKHATNLPVVGDHSFRLPGDFYRLISCHVLRGGKYVPAERADPAEKATLADNQSPCGPPRYFINWFVETGEWFVFTYPAPEAKMTAVTYFPVPTELDLDADSLSNPSSWLAFVSHGAAIKILSQLERDTTAQMIELRKLGQRIEDSVNDLDMNSPAIVRDTDGRSGGGHFW